MKNNLITTQETLKIWRGLPEELQRATVKKALDLILRIAK